MTLTELVSVIVAAVGLACVVIALRLTRRPGTARSRRRRRMALLAAVLAASGGLVGLVAQAAGNGAAAWVVAAVVALFAVLAVAVLTRVRPLR